MPEQCLFLKLSKNVDKKETIIVYYFVNIKIEEFIVMANTMVRVSITAHNILKELANRKGESIQSILSKAIEAYRRHQIFEEANRAYAALQNDSQVWKEEHEERELWDNTLSDGLDLDEQWDEDGRIICHE